MTKQLELPVQKNEEVEFDITGLTHEGDGVGKVEGFTLFVPQALPGERIKAKVLKVKKNYGYAKLVEMVEASPDRLEPPCPVYHQCGGCSLQHVSYEEQLRQKTIIVQDNLKRLGNIEHATVHPTLGMKDPWRYRNKAQVPIGEEEGGLIGGFYAQRSHRIINMESCLIQHEKNDEVIELVKRAASQLGISAYNEQTRKGLLRHVVVKVGFKTGEVMVVLVINGDKLPNQEELVNQLTKKVDGLKSLAVNVNKKQTNVIFGDQTQIIWGEPYIYDYIGNIKFAISPRSFYQVNPVQTEILYGKALEYANLTGNETVIDAYCGIGTISLFLAQKAKHVYGVEIVPEAIADAKRNARLNVMENVDFAVGEAERIIPWWYAQGIKADVVVVDPPRKGCDETLLDTLIQMKPKRIVYVSCNPSTLARDLQILEAGGYVTKEVQPVDMFPHTFHVESVAWLSLKE
ncbi:23S rRNA (uracil(1939)-C(5))-methyltransferase RlmD [Ammoniphilus sp. YIM 78166]|uniref:23S rRNA (uracil(1939)-C(5))-methyltransferase RlmD n=1 Tax=Ammoniphilus sp. YIM 78166 TaxID=1644106 RepID=UPI00106FD4F6|nr:23S rRNA (uracil(1939)-C(5))-methyltransferase RlmD [Ammoniphilus sp. YIM 78166]